MNMQAMLKELQKMQGKVAAAQSEIEGSSYEGEAGGGKVRIKISGKGEMQEIKIDKSVVDPDDVELLEDLILAAFRHAKEQSDAKSQALLGNIGMPKMPGMPGFR